MVGGTAALAAPPEAGDAPAIPAAPVLLRELGFADGAWAELVDGEVLSEHPEESASNELAVTAAILVAAPVPAVMALARSGRLVGLQEDVTAWSMLSAAEDADDSGLAVVRLTAADLEELEHLVGPEAWENVNLAPREHHALREVATALGPGVPEGEARRAVGEAYRGLLADRLVAYRRGGPEAIAPYLREGDELARPAAELASAAAATTVLARCAPGFHRAFVAYPRAVPAAGAVEHRFLVIRRTVEDRPTFILAHHALLERSGLGLLAERQLYVGHSYNSAQSVFVVLATPKGTLVVCETRSATDQVTGLRRPVAKRLGRRRLAGAVKAHLRAIRAAAGGDG
jgi:hypothetical protein